MRISIFILHFEYNRSGGTELLAGFCNLCLLNLKTKKKQSKPTSISKNLRIGETYEYLVKLLVSLRKDEENYCKNIGE